MRKLYQKIKQNIVKKRFINCNAYEKLSIMFNTKMWLKSFSKDNIDDNIIVVLLDIISEWNILHHIRIKHLATLCMNISNPNIIKKYYNRYYSKNGDERKSRNEENYILYYGDVIGKKKWLEYDIKNKQSLQDKIKNKYKKDFDKKILEWKHNLSINSANNSISLKEKREKSIWCVEYWLKRGFSEIESKDKIFEYQSKNGIKKEEKRILNPEQYNVNIYSCDFWMKRGMSKDDAVNKVKEMYIKCCSYHRRSKSSDKFINYIVEKIKNRNYQMYYGNDEYSLTNKETGNTYFYDFVILDLNLIIEYNGEHWHPRPNMNEWKNTIKQNKKYLHDMDKYNIAKNNGFDIYEIWHKNNFNDNVNKVISKINEYERRYYENTR